jgi:hypothetical protein
MATPASGGLNPGWNLAMATVPGWPGATARSLTEYGPENPSLPSENSSPGVCACKSKRRTEAAPSNDTYIVFPSSETARRPGSLPTKTGVPTAPVEGATGAMLLPPAPAAEGTLA